MIQIASIGLICAVLSLALRAWRPEFSVYISAGCGIILFFMALTQLQTIMSYAQSFFQHAEDAGTFFPILLKIMGLAYITDFTSQICRDAGEGAIASKVEMAGKILIFYVSLPVFASLLKMLEMLLQVGS